MIANRSLVLLLLLTLALVVSGCPTSGGGGGGADDDDSTADDDDSTADDDDSAADDDDSATDDDDSAAQDTVTGAVRDLTMAGVPDIPVNRPNGEETVTDASGLYTFGNLALDVESFTAMAPGMAPSRVWIDTVFQREERDGLIHPLFNEQMLTGLAMAVTSEPWDSSLGLVIVQVIVEGGALVGTSIDLSSSYSAAGVMEQGGIASGNTLLAGAVAIAFFGVEPGSTTVQLTLPGGETCTGAYEIVVEAGVVDNLRFICE